MRGTGEQNDLGWGTQLLDGRHAPNPIKPGQGEVKEKDGRFKLCHALLQRGPIGYLVDGKPSL